MVALELTGRSQRLGPLAVRLRGSAQGEIEETVNSTQGRLDLAPFTGSGSAESHFDIPLEVELLEPPSFVTLFVPQWALLHNEVPLTMAATITHKPPAAGETYEHAGLIPLVDELGAPTAVFIGDCIHIPEPCVDCCPRECGWDIGTYELPLCHDRHIYEGHEIEFMLGRCDTFLEGDYDFVTTALERCAVLLSDVLAKASDEEKLRIAQAFAEEYRAATGK